MTLDRREEFASFVFSTVILPPSPNIISVVHFRHLSTGVTITVNNGQNSISVSNDNMMRISVYFFELVNSNGDFSRAMTCRSELSSSVVPVSTHVCLVGGGDSPVTCNLGSLNTNTIEFRDGITRGWSGRKAANVGGRREHYVWRRSATPEEGYLNCYFRLDDNELVGLYVIYPSE